jgi:hypothetical protein
VDQKQIDAIYNKISQAIVIRANLIQRNVKALDMIKKRSTRLEGLALLKNNYDTEKKVLEILKQGCANALDMLGEVMQKDSKYFAEKNVNVLTQIIELLDIFYNQSIKAIESRLYYEKKYLDEKNIVLEKVYIQVLRRKWRKELLIDTKIHRIINEDEMNDALYFWKTIHDATPDDASTYVKIKNSIINTKKAVNSLPRKTLMKEAFNTFVVKGTVWAAIVANPATALYLAISGDTDPVERAEISALLWNLSGLMTRFIVLAIESRNVYNLALLNYHSQLLSNIDSKRV